MIDIHEEQSEIICADQHCFYKAYGVNVTSISQKGKLVAQNEISVELKQKFCSSTVTNLFSQLHCNVILATFK